MLKRSSCYVALGIAAITMLTPALAHAQSASAAGRPQEVRVFATSGAQRTGLLASLTTSDVTLRQNGLEVRIPLSEVSRVERVTHHKRAGALLGAYIGFVAGAALCVGCNGGEGIYRHELGAVAAGVGAGIGAAIGAARNRRDAVTLYSSSSSSSSTSPSLRIGPSLGSDRVRFTVTVGW